MWQLKLLAQFGLAHIPGGQKLNYWMQVATGKHSIANLNNYVNSVMARFAILPKVRPLDNLSVVEIGTGWEATSALALSLYGAGPIYTFDHVRHLRFVRSHQAVEQMWLSVDRLAEATSIPKALLAERLSALRSAPDLETLLDRARITYRAPADAASTGLPDRSVDVVFSHEVLGHIPPPVLHQITEETKRVLKPGGMALHFIGMDDPFATSRNGLSAMNFLRYSPRWWDFFVQNKIASNNRLREKEYIDLFRSHGATVRVIDHIVRPKDVEAVKNMKVHPRFAGMTPEELAVRYSLIAFSFDSKGEV
jgi:SAM-dependent methyltransferase